MDKFELNDSISSTPITSPTISSVNPFHGGINQHSVIPQHPVHQHLANKPTIGSTENHGVNTVPTRLSGSANEVTDAIAMKVDVLRSNPSISSAVSR